MGLNSANIAESLSSTGRGLGFGGLLLALGEPGKLAIHGHEHGSWADEENGEQGHLGRVEEEDANDSNHCEATLQKRSNIRGQSILHDLGVLLQSAQQVTDSLLVKESNVFLDDGLKEVETSFLANAFRTDQVKIVLDGSEEGTSQK